MALGTNIFYYKEGTFAALDAQAPFTDPLAWGHFVRDTGNNVDYWIRPGDGVMILREVASGSSFTGFALYDTADINDTIDDLDTVKITGANGLETNLTGTGTPAKVITVGINGMDVATTGHILSVGAGNGIEYTDPATLGGGTFNIKDGNAGSYTFDLNNPSDITFPTIGGTEVEIQDGGLAGVSVRVLLAGIGTATNGQLASKTAGSTIEWVNPLTIAAGSAGNLAINASNELSISNLQLTTPYMTAETTLVNFIANDVQYASVGEGDIVILSSDGGTYIHNGGVAGDVTDFYLITSPGNGMTSFTITADSGINRMVMDGEKIDFLGAGGLATIVSGDDIFIGLGTELVSFFTAIPVSANSYVVAHDGAGTFSYVLASTLQENTSWTASANTGTPFAVGDGDTVGFQAGIGLDTIATGSQIGIGLGPDLLGLVTNIPVLAGAYYVAHDGNGNFTFPLVSSLAGGGGTFNDFTIAGDIGTSNIITDGETLTIGGTGVGISTTAILNGIDISLSTNLQSLESEVIAIGDTADYAITYSGADNVFYANPVVESHLAAANQFFFSQERLVSFTGGSLTFTSDTSTTLKLEDTAFTATMADFVVASSSKGLILTAPNTNQYRITVNNIGALTSTPI